MSKQEIGKTMVALWRDYEAYCKAINANDGQPDLTGFITWLEYGL